MLKRDLIQRLLDELNRVIARVATLRAGGETALARAEVDGAAGSLLGMDLGLVAGLDGQRLATLLREPARVAAAARLLLLRSDLAADAGDEDGALRFLERAVEAYLEAAAGGWALDAAAREAVDAWPEGALSPRGRVLKAQLGG